MMRAYLSIRYDAGTPQIDPVWRSLLRRAANAALRRCSAGSGRDAEVSLLLTDDENIRQLNRDYRQRDAATDVLSFAMTEGEDLLPAVATEGKSPPLLLGDIVISRQRAAAQAEAYGHSEQRETVFLFVHGMLHLLGYDHERGAAEEAAMFALQDELMQELGL